MWHTLLVNHINTSEADSFSHHLISLIYSLSLLSFGLHKEQLTHGKEDAKRRMQTLLKVSFNRVDQALTLEECGIGVAASPRQFAFFGTKIEVI